MNFPIQRIPEGYDAIVALQNPEPRQKVQLETQEWTIKESIPLKHKFSAQNLKDGEKVKIYGVTVGRTRRPAAH